jgi:hypothetical protein
MINEDDDFGADETEPELLKHVPENRLYRPRIKLQKK